MCPTCSPVWVLLWVLIWSRSIGGWPHLKPCSGSLRSAWTRIQWQLSWAVAPLENSAWKTSAYVKVVIKFGPKTGCPPLDNSSSKNGLLGGKLGFFSLGTVLDRSAVSNLYGFLFRDLCRRFWGLKPRFSGIYFLRAGGTRSLYLRNTLEIPYKVLIRTL